jgi:phosphoribosylamine--glycine ligase
VIVEELLAGREASVIAICDGADAVLLPAARDHKRLLEDDRGPNTGGMGAYSPVPEIADEDLLALRDAVIRPVLAEMARRGTPFHGALFAGLMLTDAGPRVLEFNCRFGDPETQAIVPRLTTDLIPVLRAAATGRLTSAEPLMRTTSDATVALTLAVAGYPDSPLSGDAIRGIDAARDTGALVFGAGVRAETASSEPLVTSGGRVLSVVGRGRDLAEAADRAHEAAERIHFQGKQVRRDIGRVVAGAVA